MYSNYCWSNRYSHVEEHQTSVDVFHVHPPLPRSRNTTGGSHSGNETDKKSRVMVVHNKCLSAVYPS